MTNQTPLGERVRAAEAVVARFDGKPFDWGADDCVRMIAFGMRELGNAPPLREAGQYKTLLGAKRALIRTGHATLGAWVDSWGLPRIPHAYALPADIIALPGDAGENMPALTMQLSGGRLFGFLGGIGQVMVLSDPRAPLACWSVA